MKNYRKPLSEHRVNNRIDKIYQGVYKKKLFKLIIYVIIGLLAFAFLGSLKDLKANDFFLFLSAHSGTINTILSFLLFLVTSIYVFLTYKYVSLTKVLLIENSKQRDYEVKPIIYIDLYQFEVLTPDRKKEAIGENYGYTEFYNSRGTNNSKKPDTYYIDFTITIYCFGRGPAIFPEFNLTIPTEDSSIRSMSLGFKTTSDNNPIPNTIQPLSKLDVNVLLSTNIDNLELVKDEFLELMMSYKDIAGNNYQHNLFYGMTTHKLRINFFNLYHETIKVNNKLFYVMDINYSGQKLYFT